MTFFSIPQSLRMQLIIALGATTLVFMSILTLLSYRTAVYTHEKLALERLSMEVAEHGASLERLLRHQTHALEHVASMLSNELASDAGDEQLREVLLPWTMAGSGYRQLDMMDAESGKIVV